MKGPVWSGFPEYVLHEILEFPCPGAAIGWDGVRRSSAQIDRIFLSVWARNWLGSMDDERCKAARWTTLDRRGRRAIRTLRLRGYWIITGKNGKYQLTDDECAVRKWMDREEKRARMVLREMKAMECGPR